MYSWTTSIPTIQHRPQIALVRDSRDSTAQQRAPAGFPQSASRLIQEYGNLLDQELMSTDPFYALTDLFAFCAYSEAQCLNLLDSLIGSETNYESLSRKTPTLSNLLCYQEILNKHLRQLHTTIGVIKRRGGTHWPRVPKNHEKWKKVAQAADAVQKDFEDLAERAETKLERCTRGMGVMMNNALLAESKQSIAQAQRTARLTFVAFFKIPLSFTTSFFGMHFSQLTRTHGLSIWIWFATTLPILLLSIGFLFLDAGTILLYWQSFLNRVSL